MSAAAPDLATFVTACVEHAGGLAEPIEPDLVEVLVPDALRGAFGDREMVRLALDLEPAEAHPDAEPVLPGSHLLDGLIEYAEKFGRCTRAWPRCGPVRPRSILGEILRAVTFNARRVQHSEADAIRSVAAHAQFDFTVSLVSDEREEVLTTVVVDLWSGRPVEAFTALLPGLEVDPDGSSPVPARVRLTLEDAYACACAALQARMAARIERLQGLIGRRLQAETGRLELYYRSTLQDLEKRLEKAPADRAPAFHEKLAATLLEREARLLELTTKYRLRPSARLAAVRTLIYPRLFAPVVLERRGVRREIELCWDPVVGRLLMPVCETCGAEADYLELKWDGAIVCRACTAPDKV